MKAAVKYLVTIAMFCVATPSVAQDYATVVPAANSQESVIRYSRGVPYIDLQRAGGVVRVMPRGIENGELRFEISVLNLSGQQANFGAENINVSFRDRPVELLAFNDLARRADRRRGFRSLMTNLGAALQANPQTDSFNANVYGPYGYAGTVNGTVTRNRSQSELNSIEANREDRVAAIESRRNATVGSLQQSMLHTATVSPRGTHGGIIVMREIRLTERPQDISVTVNWNGEVYPFVFAVSR